MTLRFCALGSGSRGNALLVESGTTLLLVDCGLARRTLEERIRSVGREPTDITALLVTHEHGDHAQGIGAWQRRYDLPIVMTAGTAAMIGYPGEYRRARGDVELTLGSIRVTPFTVPHDAREPVQFTFTAGRRRLGVLTDTGHITRQVVARLSGCDGLAVEFNHDWHRLHDGPYPDSLKERVASPFGHLNNAQTLRLLQQVGHPELQWVVGMHVSEQNNTDALIANVVEGALPADGCRFEIARQDEPTAWYQLD